MLRFRVSRSWGFVLTLCLFTTCFFLATAQLPPVANAGSRNFSMPTIDEPPSGSSLGDPDVPMGPGDGKVGSLSVVRNGSNQVVSQNGARPVGDGAVPASVVMNRVQLLLLGLRSLYLRF
jgi:hypothetical protein